MKKLYIIAFFFAILTSCSSPERVAEKALKDFGNGLFASNIVGFSIEKISCSLTMEMFIATS